MRLGRTPLVAGVLVGVVVVVVLLGVILHPAGTSEGKAAAPVRGHPAPAFTLQSLDGKSVSLADYRGRVVLLNFWATWCVPCRHEMPEIERMQRSSAGTLTVLAIDKQEPASDVRAFARDHGLTFTLLLDPTASVFQTYRVSVQPESFWVDRHGTVAAVHYGAMSAGFMRSELRRLQQT